MTGIVLRLAGPLQSWGEHSAFSERDTLRFPTRSGITGLLAAAQGIRRGEPLDKFAQLALTVRIDRPGTLLQDFHTAGGGVSRARSVPTADGGRRPEGKSTVVTRRWYLSDAVFTVAVDGPDGLVRDIAAAIRAPRWQPYLGRRSCPPDQPVFLKVTSGDPVRELGERVPLPARRPRVAGEVRVEVITEAPTPEGGITEVSDVPVSFGRHERRYQARTVYSSTIAVPAELASYSSATAYHQALYDYARSPS
jgi:CRISPR system Cascade subunit CasD